MIARWQRDLRAGVPTARVVNLVGANLYMFLSNEADMLREIREFGATTAERWGRFEAPPGAQVLAFFQGMGRVPLGIGRGTRWSRLGGMRTLHRSGCATAVCRRHDVTDSIGSISRLGSRMWRL